MVASAPQFGLSNDDLDVLFDLFFLQRNVFKRESTRINMFNYSIQFILKFLVFNQKRLNANVLRSCQVDHCFFNPPARNFPAASLKTKNSSQAF